MGFRICEPGRFTKTDALPEGWVSLDKSGTGLFHVADLELVGIKDHVVVLVDDGGTLRVALRRVRSGEESQAAKVMIVKRGEIDGGRRRVSFGRAIKMLALTPAAVQGRYELTTKDDLLILNLVNDKTGGKGAK